MTDQAVRQYLVDAMVEYSARLVDCRTCDTLLPVFEGRLANLIIYCTEAEVDAWVKERND